MDGRLVDFTATIVEYGGRKKLEDGVDQIDESEWAVCEAVLSGKNRMDFRHLNGSSSEAFSTS